MNINYVNMKQISEAANPWSSVTEVNQNIKKVLI